jgi:hypothetical protein
MRVVHLSHDMEAIGRLFSPEHALDAVRDRRARTYDPVLGDLFVAQGRDWFVRLAEVEPWDAVLALEPEPRRVLTGVAGSGCQRAPQRRYGRCKTPGCAESMVATARRCRQGRGERLISEPPLARTFPSWTSGAGATWIRDSAGYCWLPAPRRRA